MKIHRQQKRPKVELKEDIEKLELSAVLAAPVPSATDPVAHNNCSDYDSQMDVKSEGPS